MFSLDNASKISKKSFMRRATRKMLGQSEFGGFFTRFFGVLHEDSSIISGSAGSGTGNGVGSGGITGHDPNIEDGIDSSRDSSAIQQHMSNSGSAFSFTKWFQKYFKSSKVFVEPIVAANSNSPR